MDNYSKHHLTDTTMKEKRLTETESLELISSMITNTRIRLQRNSGCTFLIMGYFTAVTSLAVWAGLHLTGDNRWQLLWFAILAGGIACWISAWRKQPATRTFVDRVIGNLWNVLSVAGVAAGLATIIEQIPILMIVVLLMGTGTAVTGLIIRFRPLTAAGFLSILLFAPLCIAVRGIDVCLVFAAAFAVMMIIPGHLLNCRYGATAEDTKNRSDV